MSPGTLLPAPQRWADLPGEPFLFTGTTRVVVDQDAGHVALAVRLAAALGDLCGHPVEVTQHDDGSPGAVVLGSGFDAAALGLPDLDPALLPEAFELRVAGDRVDVRAGTLLGLRYGIGALEGIVAAQVTAAATSGGTTPAAGSPPDDAPALALSPVLVTDHPRYAWRGLSVDVARQFLAPAVVEMLLTVMADLRLNVLHLHLTDDQGWRLAMASRPELTERSGQSAVDGGTGGFYTAADLAALVARAADLGITVVPEIDVPGHVNAALHACPELNPGGLPVPPYTGIEVGFSRLRADLPATDAFLRDVFGELADLTPGPYLHIGGDEPLSLEPAEYARLVTAAVGHVTAAGKRVVGWQEIAAVPLPAGAVVQYWHEGQDAEQVLAAANNGAAVLLSPASRTYLDMKYDASTALGLEWAGHIPVRAAYDWDPAETLPGLAPAQVLGLEAAVWTETIRTPDDLFTLLLPRLAAFAEVAWSAQDARDWTEFAPRLVVHAERWRAAGLAFHRAPELPWPDPGAGGPAGAPTR